MSQDSEDRQRLMYGCAASFCVSAMLLAVLASLAAPRIPNRENRYTVLLLSGVDKWNAWREERPGRVVDLAEVNLSKSDLAGANLSNVRFTAFVGSDLSFANLAGADLSGASMNHSALTGADLSESNISHAGLAMTNLEEARLIGVDARNASFIEANLRNAELTGMSAVGADFYHADLRGVSLKMADFTGADLRGVDFRGATGWRTATFRCADITGILASPEFLAYARLAGGIELFSASTAELKEAREECMSRTVQRRGHEAETVED